MGTEKKGKVSPFIFSPHEEPARRLRSRKWWPKTNGYIDLSQVFQKSVNANPGLKVNLGINFSCIKVLSIVYVLCSLRLVMLKTEGQKHKRNSLLKSYKNEIKILANHGSA